MKSDQASCEGSISSEDQVVLKYDVDSLAFGQPVSIACLESLTLKARSTF